MDRFYGSKELSNLRTHGLIVEIVCQEKSFNYFILFIMPVNSEFAEERFSLTEKKISYILPQC